MASRWIWSRAQLADDRAVTEDDDAIGAGFDLVQPVGDKDDRHAIGLEFADDPHQPIGLGGRQAGRRLVHDDDAGVERKRLGDLQKLALRKGEVGNEIVDLEVDVQSLQQWRDDRVWSLSLRSTSLRGPPDSGSRPISTFAPTSRLSKRFSS